jgi:hypothetical protein
VEDIGIGSGRTPEVLRAGNVSRFYLTFRGTREQKVRDHDTRLRISLGTVQAVDLWRQLDRLLTDAEKDPTGLAPEPAF